MAIFTSSQTVSAATAKAQVASSLAVEVVEHAYFAAEHGDAGIRAVGGRREAERFLAEQDSAEGVSELVAALAGRAG